MIMNRETCDYAVYAEKEVVEEVFDPAIEITLEDAEEIDSALQIGDVCQVPVQSKEFGRIATMNAKNLILQKIREEERKVVYDQYFEKEKDIVTGIVQRYVGKISVSIWVKQMPCSQKMSRSKEKCLNRQTALNCTL